MLNRLLSGGPERAALRTSLVALVAASALAAGTLHAAGPSFWQVATQADFLKGDADQLSIDSHGRLLLGPASEVVYEAPAPFLWTMTQAPDGTTYIGSGNDGLVYRVDKDGKGAPFFDADELQVHGLAAAPNGALYVASSPDGKIYRVESGEKSSVFYDPDDKYIWALAVDKSGNVYAATGEKGLVYKITPDGKGSVFYNTKATHAVSLTFDRDGNLLVGTESPGRLFRVTPAGTPFVLLDSPFQEIRAIRVDDKGAIYVAAMNGKATDTPSPTTPVRVETPAVPSSPTPSVSTEITSIAIVDVSAAPSTPTASRPSGQPIGAIYRIAADGLWDTVWESREDTPYDLAIDPNGSLLVATGGKGKLFRLSGDPLQATLVTRAPAQQITMLGRDATGRTTFLTSNPGKLHRLSAERAERGTYESDVRDAQTVATWGTVAWHATSVPGGRVEVQTRSGNTRTPDDTWSPWSAVYTDQNGSPIASPKARYLQWRATLAGRDASPVLTSVTVAYLQRNLRPKVLSITVHGPGTVFQKPFSTGETEIAGFDGDLTQQRVQAGAAASSPTSGPALGRRGYQKGLQTFVWRAEDDNNDDLRYDVQYRREGDTSWRLLKAGLDDPIVVWDTTSVPNGTYQIRVLALDAPSNTPAAALAGELESNTFDIDNTPPAITVGSPRREGTRTIVPFEVKDQDSAVRKVEVSLDGERWRPIYPKDGIADSRTEQFELPLEGEAAGRNVIIRATDALANVASARADAAAPRR